MRESEKIAHVSARGASIAFSLPIAIAAMVGIGLVRPALVGAFGAAAEKHDVYPLPSPQQTVALSLGYRAALADYLFAHVLVSYGLHFQDKRRFEDVGNYLEAINELDPKFERPYRVADTLLTLQVRAVGPEYYRRARAIQERGMKEFPFDAALWASAGQFMAYLAPGSLTDPKERADFQLAGARALAHACELVSDDRTIPYHCIGAAGLLTDAGLQAAAVHFLDRVAMTTEDPDIRGMAAAQLGRLGASSVALSRRRRFESAWSSDLPFVSMGAMLTVGPNWKPEACAGLGVKCASSWRAWGELDAAAQASTNDD